MRAATVLALAFGVWIAVTPGWGQMLPEIKDVYARPRTASLLGPNSTPQEILDRHRQVLENAFAIQFDIDLRASGFLSDVLPRVSGTLVVQGGRGLNPGSYRAAIQGTSPDASRLLGTLLGVPEKRVWVDLVRRNVVEVEHEALPGPAGGVADWIERLAIAGFRIESPAGTVEIDGSSADGTGGSFTLHSVDGARGEHVYSTFAALDATLRRAERVVADANGRVGSVSIELTNPVVDPPLPPRAFEIVYPPGFRRERPASP